MQIYFLSRFIKFHFQFIPVYFLQQILYLVPKSFLSMIPIFFSEHKTSVKGIFPSIHPSKRYFKDILCLILCFWVTTFIPRKESLLLSSMQCFPLSIVVSVHGPNVKGWYLSSKSGATCHLTSGRRDMSQQQYCFDRFLFFCSF